MAVGVGMVSGGAGDHSGGAAGVSLQSGCRKGASTQSVSCLSVLLCGGGSDEP